MMKYSETEKKAIEIRQKLNLKHYGINDMFKLISDLNIDLIRYPFGKDEILGFSTIFRNKKVIVSNSSEILSREIFTIAHELGHILFDLDDHRKKTIIDLNPDDVNINEKEKRANQFANALLLPYDEIKKFIELELNQEIHRLTPYDIVNIQLEFNVSYQTIVYRLLNLKLISIEHKEKLFYFQENHGSKRMFSDLNLNTSLIEPTNRVIIPKKYLSYIVSNHQHGYIPDTSLEKALKMIGVNADFFKNYDFKDHFIK
jgi:Zn-dependent peptidase ImmA (M78 family)